MVFISLIVGCENSQAEEHEAVEKLKLGHYTFHIPEKNAMTKAVPFWLRWLPGLDEGSSSALILFKDQEVKESIPTYKFTDKNKYRDDIEVLLMVLTPEEVQRYHNPQYGQLEDLWYSKGSYKKRRVELDEKYGWFKVYREIEYPYSWAYLSQTPDENKTVPNEPLDFWISHCLLSGPKDDQTASCNSYVLVDDIVMEFSVSDYNLLALEEIKQFLKTKLRSWLQVDTKVTELFKKPTQ